jgi:hypothetical protein
MEGFKLYKLETPLRAYNVDGTENKRGTIKNYVKLDLEINGRKTPTELFVTGLGKERIILGFPWLNEQNPDINWRTGKFAWREKERRFFFNNRKIHPMELARKLARQAIKPLERKRLRTTVTEEVDEEEHLNSTQNPIEEDTELSVLISTITGDTDNCTWINSKSTTATSAKHNLTW